MAKLRTTINRGGQHYIGALIRVADGAQINCALRTNARKVHDLRALQPLTVPKNTYTECERVRERERGALADYQRLAATKIYERIECVPRAFEVCVMRQMRR